MVHGMSETRTPAETAALLGRTDVNDLEEILAITNTDAEETIRAVKAACPQMGLEVLTPDFKGQLNDVDIVLEARPDCFSHNIETVEAMHRIVRPQARYERSLAVLERAAQRNTSLVKTGLMLGLGETNEQILATMQDLVNAGVQILNLGQYLRPSKRHLPVMRWVTPEEFAMFKVEGERMGLAHVESGPLVRSSYHAERHV